MAVKNFLAYGPQRLGTDHIDIYRLARLDPTVPTEDTVGTIAEMIKVGYVRDIGPPQVGVETVARPQGAPDNGPARCALADQPQAGGGSLCAAQNCWVSA